MRWITLGLVVVMAAACGPSAEELAQAAAEAARAEQDSLMAFAAETFDASVFDTLTWEDDQKKIDRGVQVYNFSCAKCHGAAGAGDGGWVSGADTLTPPSFADPAWAMGEDLNAIRRAIFVGTREKMPHWGLAGLKAEAVDAVSAHILTFRPAEEGEEG
jgi:mono/diheme cytochrome c family protein